MTPMQALVLMEIKRAGAAGLPLERLVSVCASWRELRRMDPPKDPRACVRVTVHQVKAFGHLIGDGRAGDRRYRLAG